MARFHLRAAAALALLTPASPGAAATYRNPTYHCEFQLPAGYVAWPSSAVAQANRFARERAPGHKIEFIAGYHPRGNRMAGAYPYLLIQVQEQSTANTTYDDIERMLARETKSAFKQAKGMISDIARELTPGTASLDRRYNRVIIRYRMSSPLTGPVEGVSVCMIGREALVSLHYYDHASKFDESSKKFLRAADTFEFDPGYNFVPAKASAKKFNFNLDGANQRVLVGALCSGCVGAVALMFRQARRKPAPPVSGDPTAAPPRL